MSHVIESAFRIWRGQEVFDIGPGGVALLPRDQAHTFKAHVLGQRWMAAGYPDVT